jgi:hypothetical protein
MRGAYLTRVAPSAVAAAIGIAGAIGITGETHTWAQDSTAAPPAGSSDQSAFLADNKAAMDRMMAGMTVTPTGDADVDFVAMMIPHHQGAIDMAIAELRYGKNEQLRRLAQEIIVDQQQEIGAMRLALGQPLPPSGPAPTQIPPSYPSASPDRTTHDHPATTQDSMHDCMPAPPAVPTR